MRSKYITERRVIAICGILGFISNAPSVANYNALEKLFRASMTRGKDATGVCYNSKEEGFWVEKHHVDAEEFIGGFLHKRRKAIAQTRICIGHTRAWTTGAPDNNHNNHPVYSKNYILIHNGMCVSTPEVGKYPYIGEVDSEKILAQIEDKGIKSGLENCSGSAALAFIYRKKKTEVLLYRETNPIHLAYKRDVPTIFFSSTEEILRKALDNTKMLGFFPEFSFSSLPENELWKVRLIGNDKITLKKVDDITWGKSRYTSTQSYVYPYGDSYMGEGMVNSHTSPRGTGTAAHDREWVSKFSTKHGGHGRGQVQSTKLVASNKYEWNHYWDVDLGEMRTIVKHDWTWWPEEKVWYHNDSQIIRRYVREKRRCEIATPEKAITLGWISTLPDPYIRVTIEKK